MQDTLEHPGVLENLKASGKLKSVKPDPKHTKNFNEAIIDYKLDELRVKYGGNPSSTVGGNYMAGF